MIEAIKPAVVCSLFTERERERERERKFVVGCTVLFSNSFCILILQLRLNNKLFHEVVNYAITRRLFNSPLNHLMFSKTVFRLVVIS